MFTLSAQNQQDMKSLLPQTHHHHFVYPEFQLSNRSGELTEKQRTVGDTVSSHNLAFHIENLIQKKHHSTQQGTGSAIITGIQGEISQEETVSSSNIHNNIDLQPDDVVDAKPKLIIINDDDDSSNSGGRC